MSIHELKRLLSHARAIPYRNVGKIRLVIDPKLPEEVRNAAVKCVKLFAPHILDEWEEPDTNTKKKWVADGMTMQEVCDDPPPKDIDPMMCDVSWLVDRTKRWHFDLTLDNGKLKMKPHDGYKEEDIRKLLPSWHGVAVKNRLQEVIEHIREHCTKDKN